MFGMALTRPSSTMQLMSGVDVFAHVCEQKVEILSNYWDSIQLYDETFQFLSNVTGFLGCFILENYHKLELKFCKEVRSRPESLVADSLSMHALQPLERHGRRG